MKGKDEESDGEDKHCRRRPPAHITPARPSPHHRSPAPTPAAPPPFPLTAKVCQANVAHGLHERRVERTGSQGVALTVRRGRWRNHLVLVCVAHRPRLAEAV